MEIRMTAKETGQSVLQSLLTWSWTKRLLYWIIMSAGTASELIFLLASLWVSVNANVHGFVLTFLSEKQALNLTYLATTAYVALPECIVGLAVITTIGHIKMVKRGGAMSVVWSILFGIPALIFLMLSLVTLGCSVANVTFTMPAFFVVIRALAGFSFAFSAFIYHFLGKPQEYERLQEKDITIANLQKEVSEIKVEWQKETARLNADWQHEKAQLNAEIENQNELLLESKKQQTALLNAVNKSSDTALRGYSEDFITTLKSGIKTVSIDDINRHTGHSKRKIQRAITDGALQTAPRNNELIRVASLLEWLKQTPAKTDTEPELYVVNG